MFTNTPLARGLKAFAIAGVLIVGGANLVQAGEDRFLGSSEQARLTEDNVGLVAKARGDAKARRSTRSRVLSGGSGVLFKDTLVTGIDTRMIVDFDDGSVLSVGDNSELLIDEMVYEPGVEGRGVITLTKGVFRMVSGEINKVPGGSLVMNTPSATIGVRGTDFWGDQTEERLLMALIDNGRLEITAQGQTVVLTEPLSAVVVEAGKAPGAAFSLTPEQLQEAAKTVTW